MTAAPAGDPARLAAALAPPVGAALAALGTAVIADPANAALAARLAGQTGAVAGVGHQLRRFFLQLIVRVGATGDPGGALAQWRAARWPAWVRWLGTGGPFDAASWPDLAACRLAAGAAAAVGPLADALGALLPEDRAALTGDGGFAVAGRLHERLLARTAVLAPGGRAVRLAEGGDRRRDGAYYTDAVPINALIDSALAPVVAARGAAALDAVTVCDPACGSGEFLVAAARHLVAARRPADPAAARAAWRAVVTTALHGVDRDPDAVALCRARLAWLAGGDDPAITAPLATRVRVADSLALDWAAAWPEVARAGGFAAVIGNPPHGSRPRDAGARAARFPEAQAARNSAADFLALALRLIAPDGRSGLVMPKSLSFSHAWRDLRVAVRPGLVAAHDLGCGFADVRLEQMLVTVGHPDRAAGRPPTVAVGRLAPDGPPCGHAVARDAVARRDALPSGVRDARDLALLDAIDAGAAGRLGTELRTRRGQPLQRLLVPSDRPGGGVPVLAGRDIADFARPRPRRRLPDRAPPPPGGLRLLAPGQVVVQNIIAHLTRPTDHLRLIATVVDRPLAALDTVNALEPHPAPAALCAYLLSDLVNWYLYVGVYNRAVRTMHFDNWTLERLPAPPPGLLATLAPVAARLAAAPGDRAAWQALNAAVADAFAVPPALRGHLTPLGRGRAVSGRSGSAPTDATG